MRAAGELAAMPANFGCVQWAVASAMRLTTGQLRDPALLAFDPEEELAKHGDLVTAVAARLGPADNVLDARTGDLVAAWVPVVAGGHIRAQALGVCVGYRAAFIRPDGSVCRLDLVDCIGRWSQCLVLR